MTTSRQILLLLTACVVMLALMLAYDTRTGSGEEAPPADIGEPLVIDRCDQHAGYGTCPAQPVVAAAEYTG